MKLLIDMNLSPRWVDLLIAAGFEASHWVSLGAKNAPDTEIILDPSVERARAWVWLIGWQGATTLRAGARKEEQRSQTVSQTRDRVRSGFTQSVSVSEGANACTHAASRGLMSGQPRNQGS